MSRWSFPEWFVEDDVRATVWNARAAGASTGAIVEVLEATTFDGRPTDRFERIVERIPEQTAAQSADGNRRLSQPPSTSIEPRERPPRRFSVRDVAYLSDTEFARVLGLALEQFDGETRRPTSDDQSAIDLLWDRPDETVGLRTVASTGGGVGASTVETVVEASPVDRVDQLVVVTNAEFATRATTVAGDAGVSLIDGDHLETIYDRAALPADAVGTVLEDGAEHDGLLSEIVDLDPVPEPSRSIDTGPTPTAAEIETISHPRDQQRLDDDRRDGTDTGGGESVEPSDGESEPAWGDDGEPRSEPPPGETGVLYADPDEDGDYDAFDDFAEGI